MGMGRGDHRCCYCDGCYCMGGVEMTPIAWVVEQSLQASERFRHLAVKPEEFSFTIDGKKCHAIKGKASVITDKSGEARFVFGVWREEE